MSSRVFLTISLIPAAHLSWRLLLRTVGKFFNLDKAEVAPSERDKELQTDWKIIEKQPPKSISLP